MGFSSMQIRPEVAVGKDVNGNRGLEIIPIRLSYQPFDEWMFKLGYSVNYTQARGSSELMSWNHYSQGIMVKVEYKPLKFIEKLIPIGTLSDFAISFTKSFSSKYDGANNPVSYLIDTPYERLGVGFNISL